MNKNGLIKWIILICVTAWSLVLVTPPLDRTDEQGNVTKGKITFGLDLQGGSSFVVEVVTNDLSADSLKDAQARALEVIRNRVDGMGVSEPIIYPEPRSQRIVVQIPGLTVEDRDRAVDLIQSAAFLEFRMVHAKNDKLIEDLFDDGKSPEGFKIVTFEEQGASGRWVDLNFYRYDAGLDAEKVGEVACRKKARSFHAPAGTEMLMTEEIREGQTFYRPYFVSRRRELTGERIKNAGIDYNQFGQSYVTMKFDAKGKRKFYNTTKDYAPGGTKNPSMDGRRYLGIVLDGTLYSAPYIKTAIAGGEAIIEGSFSLKEAQDLAIVLRAGALPAPVQVVEERTVDPSLGQDAISSGKRAAVYAGCAVLVFMLLYYMVAGVVANLALILDILLLPLGMMVMSGFLSLLTAGGGTGTGPIGLPTLTLPGIAGIVLTIGMAVDANVLIFERIREELDTGKRLSSSITAGYEKAFSTIFDANITTLLTAVILFWQGSGPIRGFAVTLAAGILVSMYTALVVTRMFFNVYASKKKEGTIKMLALIRKPSINFLSKRYIAALLSVALILGTWTMFVLRGDDNFGVDFTGGKALVFLFEDKQTVEEVRDTLADAGIGEAYIQYQKELAPDEAGVVQEFLEVKVDFDEGDAAKETLLSTFGESAGFHVVKEDSVGPQVGEELKKKGLTAIVLALVGIVIYISIRFEFAFAMGAIVALAHDVLITVGIYCLMGRQLSLPIVAALLTIVGYSVNDTIVVFDRVREDLKLYRGRPYSEIANLSINQTLSRTILTSLTTLLSVVVLLIFGGGAIYDFALALLIGILVGTYSSIFVATPTMLLWHREKMSKAV